MAITRQQVAYSVAIPVARLLDLDRGSSPAALPDALGDSYLCEHNPVYAAIRQAAVGFGYIFSARDASIWRDYLTLSLTTLPQILESKVIPYFDTRVTLQRLVEKHPKIGLSPGFLLNDMRPNRTLHEAAHCVAHSVCEDPGAGLRTVVPDDRERFVIQSVFEESFASTVERLGGLAKWSQIPDEIFYALNSYIPVQEAAGAALERARAAAGEERLFALLLLSHFEANFSGDAPTEAAIERILLAADCQGVDQAVVREVVYTAFDLNPQFRAYTTPAYFEILGYSRDYRASAGRNWLASAPNVAFTRGFLGRLFALTLAPVECRER